ncbi:MAG: hypothetical protein HYX92_05855 [Chloroflexi bacterium]|nr:hypothetical protein [Chloroflexota bacterium]
MTDNSGKARIEVANPVAEVRPEAIMPARRPNSISGKTVGLWWNTKSHGDVALSAAAEAIQQRYENVTIVRITRDMSHLPGPYGRVQESGCDAVIASTAD